MANKPMAPVAYDAPVEPKVLYPEWMQPVEYRSPVDTADGRESLMRFADGELSKGWRGAEEPGEELTDRCVKDAEARRAIAGGLPDAPEDMPAVSVQGGKPFSF